MQAKGNFEVPHVGICQDVEGGPAMDIIMPHHSHQHDSLYLLKDGYIFADVCTRDNSCVARRDCEHEHDKHGRFWWQGQSGKCLGTAWQAVCSILSHLAMSSIPGLLSLQGLLQSHTRQVRRSMSRASGQLQPHLDLPRARHRCWR